MRQNPSARPRRKARSWAVLCALAACLAALASGAAWGGDRATSTKTFSSSAAHTAGTEYSSGFLVEHYAEGVLLVNVSALTGAPTVDITVETSEDNSTYFYHSKIEQIGATGATAYALTNFGKYLRLKEVIGGVTSVTFEIKGVFKN